MILKIFTLLPPKGEVGNTDQSRIPQRSTKWIEADNITINGQEDGFTYVANSSDEMIEEGFIPFTQGFELLNDAGVLLERYIKKQR